MMSLPPAAIGVVGCCVTVKPEGTVTVPTVTGAPAFCTVNVRVISVNCWTVPKSVPSRNINRPVVDDFRGVQTLHRQFAPRKGRIDNRL